MLKKDFVDKILSTEPEQCYDLLVQCGHTPLTALVNMRWKQTALEKHSAALAETHAVRVKELREEYEDSRRQRQPRDRCEPVSERKKKSVKWKRPLSAVNVQKKMKKKKKNEE